MLTKLPKHNHFDYIPRYYNPDTDPEQQRRERYRFHSKTRKGKHSSFIRLIILLIAAIVIYLLLTQ